MIQVWFGYTYSIYYKKGVKKLEKKIVTRKLTESVKNDRVAMKLELWSWKLLIWILIT